MSREVAGKIPFQPTPPHGWTQGKKEDEEPRGGVTEKGVPMWRLAAAAGEPKRRAGNDAEMGSLPHEEGQGSAGLPNKKINQKVDKKKQKHGGAQLPILPKNATSKTAGLTMPDGHGEAADGPAPHVTYFPAIPAAEPPWGGNSCTVGGERALLGANVAEGRVSGNANDGEVP